MAAEHEVKRSQEDEGSAERELQPGLFPRQDDADEIPSQQHLAFPPVVQKREAHKDDAEDIPSEGHLAFPPRGQTPEEPKDSEDADRSPCVPAGEDDAKAAADVRFTPEETVFIFDWDDTILPSTWVQRNGLRLNEDSEPADRQREQLAEVANAAAETLRLAKQHGTVILVTNAERGWIELSCLKFLPTLMPLLENVKIVSARTSYESSACPSPLDWKLRAFENEIGRVYGAATLNAPEMRKNVLSLGDSVHERQALLEATAPLPSCRAKSLKFVERPDIAQIVKQHSLITSCFERIVHLDDNMDLCIRCQ
mmetsp:Transcript_22810/g.58182  ORF Transcript_22810/g.58182 Transcript_22810/m.58182 type:complete len:311 (+) Transcript_22810:69-1001(+)